MTGTSAVLLIGKIFLRAMQQGIPGFEYESGLMFKLQPATTYVIFRLTTSAKRIKAISNQNNLLRERINNV